MNSNQGEIVRQQSGRLETENGFLYRDLNKNGKLDVYKDPRQPIETRVQDLLHQMTLEEKVGHLGQQGAEGLCPRPVGAGRQKDRAGRAALAGLPNRERAGH